MSARSAGWRYSSRSSQKPVRLATARKVMEAVRGRQGMPFAKTVAPGNKPEIALTSLTGPVCSMHIPVLSDIPGSLVSQHEHTIIVTEDIVL